jgi:P-type Ca2+ transporter type 2C
VQLLWVNLIQDTLGALALATDPPTKALLDRQPDAKGASMISFNMWKMIFGQSILQLAVTVTLAFAGPKLFPNWSSDILSTLVFNTFVWLQFFNEINCRRIDNRLNVFEGVHKNGLFILIMVVIVVCQIILINFGGAAFSVTRLDGLQWLISVLLGLVTIPWGIALRLLPNQYIEYLIPSYFYRRRRRVLFDEESQPTNWNATVEVIRDDLLVIKRLRNRHRLGNLGTRGREIQPQAVRPHTPYDPPLSPMPVEDRPGLLVTPASSIVSSPSSSTGRLYSVFNASALVPALMASSITIPVSIHHEEEDPPVPNAAELGIEIYHKTRGHGGVRSSPEARLGTSQSAAQSQL